MSVKEVYDWGTIVRVSLKAESIVEEAVLKVDVNVERILEGPEKDVPNLKMNIP
jgi:hypothetical protein